MGQALLIEVAWRGIARHAGAVMVRHGRHFLGRDGLRGGSGVETGLAASLMGSAALLPAICALLVAVGGLVRAWTISRPRTPSKRKSSRSNGLFSGRGRRHSDGNGSGALEWQRSIDAWFKRCGRCDLGIVGHFWLQNARGWKSLELGSWLDASVLGFFSR